MDATRLANQYLKANTLIQNVMISIWWPDANAVHYNFMGLCYVYFYPHTADFFKGQAVMNNKSGVCFG